MITFNQNLSHYYTISLKSEDENTNFTVFRSVFGGIELKGRQNIYMTGKHPHIFIYCI